MLLRAVYTILLLEASCARNVRRRNFGLCFEVRSMSQQSRRVHIKYRRGRALEFPATGQRVELNRRLLKTISRLLPLLSSPRTPQPMISLPANRGACYMSPRSPLSWNDDQEHPGDSRGYFDNYQHVTQRRNVTLIFCRTIYFKG